MDNYLNLAINNLKNEQINWLTESNNELLQDFSNLTDIIMEFISKFSMEISRLILNVGYISERYTNNPKILHKISEKDVEIEELMLIKARNSNIQILMNHIDNIYSMKTSKDKMNK